MHFPNGINADEMDKKMLMGVTKETDMDNIGRKEFITPQFVGSRWMIKKEKLVSDH